MNRATAARVAEIAETGETPLDYMLRIMRDETMEPERRDKAAIAAAPFVPPRLAPLSEGGERGIIVVPLDQTDMEC